MLKRTLTYSLGIQRFSPDYDSNDVVRRWLPDMIKSITEIVMLSTLYTEMKGIHIVSTYLIYEKRSLKGQH